MKRVVFDRKESKGYPYSGINYKTETIILFTKKDTGTVLYHKDKKEIGKCKTGWNEGVFMVCPHTVCFENVDDTPKLKIEQTQEKVGLEKILFVKLLKDEISRFLFLAIVEKENLFSKYFTKDGDLLPGILD